MHQPTFDEKKFAELILYISLRSEEDKSFGATKLNKVLFYVDFRSYANTGKPITGATYQKLTHGPAPRQLLPTKQRMIVAGHLFEREVQTMRGTQKRPIALREPDLSVFSAEEISLVDYVLSTLSGRSATEVSDMTHQLPGWILTDLNATIPYETIFIEYEMPELTVEQVDYGRKVAERINAAA